MTPLHYIIAAYATCFPILLIAARLAPLGYEDQQGFHHGREGLGGFEAGEFRTIHEEVSK